ncbi:MAG UNVERIFIED_CONTAM: cysteine desulfurase [Rickettsiaceae bacterium]
MISATNVSAAVNLVAASLKLPAGGEILMTDHEYGAMVWCWKRAARRLGLTLRTFPLPTNTENPAEIVEAAMRAMTHRTRVLFSATFYLRPA